MRVKGTLIFVKGSPLTFFSMTPYGTHAPLWLVGIMRTPPPAWKPMRSEAMLCVPLLIPHGVPSPPVIGKGEGPSVRETLWGWGWGPLTHSHLACPS